MCQQLAYAICRDVLFFNLKLNNKAFKIISLTRSPSQSKDETKILRANLEISLDQILKNNLFLVTTLKYIIAKLN